MTPITCPPACSAALASAPISPTRPPPNTTVICRAASKRPTERASSMYSGFVPGLDAQKTHTLFIWAI